VVGIDRDEIDLQGLTAGGDVDGVVLAPTHLYPAVITSGLKPRRVRWVHRYRGNAVLHFIGDLVLQGIIDRLYRLTLFHAAVYATAMVSQILSHTGDDTLMLYKGCDNLFVGMSVLVHARERLVLVLWYAMKEQGAERVHVDLRAGAGFLGSCLAVSEYVVWRYVVQIR